MKVVTPGAAARHTGSKYLGVLIAAKYARNLNELLREELVEEPVYGGAPLREKLTTTAIGKVAEGSLEYQLTNRYRGAP